MLVFLTGVFSLNGFDLPCEFKRVTNWKYGYSNGFDTCRTSNLLTASFRNEFVTTVNEISLNAFDKSSYRSITIVSPADFIPEGMGDFFPQLSGFEIAYTKINSLKKADLAQFPKLKELWIYGNEVHTLPANLFEGTRGLHFIDFSGNKIVRIGKGILRPLELLDKVNFESNVCIDKSMYNKFGVNSLVATMESDCSNESVESATTAVNI